jgi:steroid delta-isomerase-like uncharacterized protein
MTTTHRDLIDDYYGALNTGQFERLDELLSDQFGDHETMFSIPPTRAGLQEKYALLRGAFSDFRFTVDDSVAADDRIAVRLTVQGTHDGDFMGRPATGAQFRVDSVGIFRIEDARIVEHWGVFDQMAMLRQVSAPA